MERGKPEFRRFNDGWNATEFFHLFVYVRGTTVFIFSLQFSTNAFENPELS